MVSHVLGILKFLRVCYLCLEDAKGSPEVVEVVCGEFSCWKAIF